MLKHSLELLENQACVTEYIFETLPLIGCVKPIASRVASGFGYLGKGFVRFELFFLFFTFHISSQLTHLTIKQRRKPAGLPSVYSGVPNHVSASTIRLHLLQNGNFTNSSSSMYSIAHFFFLAKASTQRQIRSAVPLLPCPNMASVGFVSTDPTTAKRQLWDRLPGKYQLERWAHHDERIDGETFHDRHMHNPSHGVSELTSRAPTDATYEAEILQTSTIELKTKSGKEATRTEQRVFRLRQNGDWSVWNTDGDGVVTEKFTALTLKGEIEEDEPRNGERYQNAVLKGDKQPCMVGEEGHEKWEQDIELQFTMGREPYWVMIHELYPDDEWKMSFPDMWKMFMAMLESKMWQADTISPVTGGGTV